MKNILVIATILFVFHYDIAAQNVESAGLSVSGIIPGTCNDDYWVSPRSGYNERRKIFLDYCTVHQGNIGGRQGLFSQIAVMENGLPVNERMVREAITFVYSNRDCNDFTLGGLLRLVYLNKEKKALSEELVNDILDCLLWFKYWWDDPRPDTEYRCYHTENHQGLYHSIELLSGQLFTEVQFADDRTGREHMQHADPLLKQWLEYRVLYGFSEWLSNTYYSVDIMILTNLYDFAEDEFVRDRADLLLDMLMYDMSLNNFRGLFGSTHGRAYSPQIKDAHDDESSNIMKLMFGMGVYNSSIAVGAVCLVTSSYRCPEVIEKIAADHSQIVWSKQRHSINAEEADLYGLNYDEHTTNLFWGMQEFIHPDVINMSQKISEKYSVWPYRDYDRYQSEYERQKKEFGKIINPYLDRFALSEANICTYRTTGYMLSSVQDYRPGSPGYQQHIWQATMGVNAIVFTTNPGSREEGVCPNLWAGNASMPRAAQYKNVLACIYHIPEKTRLSFSHAFFPSYLFDETIEKKNWIFARKGQAFLGLYSQNETKWCYNKNGQKSELEVDAGDNIWICEMGDEKQWGSFQYFIEKILEQQVNCEGLNVVYNSPSLGPVRFGWEKEFEVAGEVIKLDKFPRVSNTYSHVDFTDRYWTIEYNGQRLVLDFKKGKRFETLTDI